MAPVFPYEFPRRKLQKIEMFEIFKAPKRCRSPSYKINFYTFCCKTNKETKNTSKYLNNGLKIMAHG
jgi:hypothetical protein